MRLAAGVTFVPLVAESLGGWSEGAVHQIARIGCRVGQKLGILPAEDVKHLFQHLLICLWKGNATLCSHHLPFSTLPGLTGISRLT